MNDKEQIEEMAKDIEKYIVVGWRKELYIESAKSFYDKGYRQVKDKVMLSKEEQERLNATETRIKQLKNEINDYKQRYASAEKRYEQLVQSSCEALAKKGKETATEIIEYLRENGRKYEVWYLISELRKQYGVEVE